MKLEDKLDKVRECLKGKKVLVAYSGGADSTLLAKLAHESARKSVAVTVDNGVLPEDLTAKAGEIAEEIGIKHTVLKENFLKDQNFGSNPPQRCYICKNKMYTILEQYLKDIKYDAIADGTNMSDLLEDRPGISVIQQKKILTPLVYGRMTAEDVKNALEKFKLKYSPSTTCYATRIQVGTEIIPARIKRIEKAETLIKNITGLKVVRVRDEDHKARIEVSNLDKLLKSSVLNQINTELNSMGFKRVLIDITTHGKSDKELVIYKPCRDEANKIMMETELPFQINISETCQELEKMGEVKCSQPMGVVMAELNGSNVTIFKKGKIVARRIKDKESAKELMNNVLPLIRREI